MEETFQEIVNELKKTRDELQLQAHLFKAETKETWDKAEKKWSEFQRSAGELDKTIDKSSQNISTAAQLLADEIKSSYNQISKILKR